MLPYSQIRYDRTSSDDVPKNHRKKLSRQKKASHRELRKAEKKALRDEYGF